MAVLCVRKMNAKIKRKVYSTLVKPELVYGAETFIENTMEVGETRMLRWMCRVTKLGKIRNERIRGTTIVEEIA